jgi:hypothetical protein
MSFTSASLTLEGGFRLEVPPETAFPFFSPRGEEAWVPGWKPEILYPAGAEWETGLVFRTVHDGQESIWFIRELDRERHRVTYDRVDVGMTATTVRVTCEEIVPGSTDVTVRYTFVGISEAGNELVRSRDAGDFANRMGGWRDAITAVL